MNAMLGIVSVNALGATVLAGIVVIATRFVKRPAVVHALWLLVLVELLSVPVLRVAVPSALVPGMWSGPFHTAQTALPPGSVTPPAPDGQVLPAVAASSTRLIRWGAIVTATWLGGAILVLALAFHRCLRFARLLRTASPAHGSLATEAASVAARLGVSSCPEVRVVRVVMSPMLWFAGRSPQLLLPKGLLHRLQTAELQALLAHELAHLRRRDHWVRWFELIVGALFWWHPVVWWARRRMRTAEEGSCDAWVVHVLSGHARAYAEGLLKTAEFIVESRTAVPVVACGAA